MEPKKRNKRGNKTNVSKNTTKSARIGRLDDATLVYYRKVSENLVEIHSSNDQEKGSLQLFVCSYYRSPGFHMQPGYGDVIKVRGLF